MEIEETKSEDSGVIVTVCRDCVFAVYDGESQIDCDLSRLEMFEKNGAVIVGQDDGNKKYYNIVNRFCNTYRTEEWAKQHALRDLVTIAFKEASIKCSFIIYADDKASLEDVRASLASVQDQGDIQATSVIILLNAHNVEVSKYIDLLREQSIPWSIKNVVLEKSNTPIPVGKAVDIAVEYLTFPTYYCFAKAGYIWPPNYLNVINHALNYEMLRIVALLPDQDGNGLMMNTFLHNKLLGGNREKPILDKVLEIAELEDTKHQIHTWESLRDSV